MLQPWINQPDSWSKSTYSSGFSHGVVGEKEHNLSSSLIRRHLEQASDAMAPPTFEGLQDARRHIESAHAVYNVRMRVVMEGIL